VFISAFFALVVNAAHAHPGHQDLPIPEAISVPEGNQLKLALIGSGIQRYECAAVNGSYAWKFITPEADLFDQRDRPAGRHGAGPYWQALDASQVTATKRNEANVAQDSIPWLLLEATGHSQQGLFDDITFIQRVETRGGLAPEAVCTEANSGEQAQVPYRALYKFFHAAHCD
jgi:hypothetical protein